MTFLDVLALAEGRALDKSYLKSDSKYIWDYKLNKHNKLELIPGTSGKAGFKDKINIQELVDYIESEGLKVDYVEMEDIDDLVLARL